MDLEIELVSKRSEKSEVLKQIELAFSFLSSPLRMRIEPMREREECGRIRSRDDRRREDRTPYKSPEKVCYGVALIPY